MAKLSRDELCMAELSRDELCVANLNEDELCEAELTSFWLGSSGRAQQGMSSTVPTLNDHNFLVQSPFCAFVDSMERPLSLKSIHPVGFSCQSLLM